ncbi:DUF433 domain-containing protein [Humisphaera borealis]|uniref:DUF433 domain-containing protein n=2 Tax=Humisphaera borealis TaxID=2807512 RepID=A0A7M2X3X4_9BACT|nr:DUF433 domain-containing protein [Humisphaera borealis]
MTRAEKAQLLTRVAADLAMEPEQPATPVASAIRKTPGVAGGDACIRNTRIAVWTLVQLKKLGRTEAQLLADFQGLTRDDLDAAWTYYRDHTSEIEEAILAEAREG